MDRQRITIISVVLFFVLFLVVIATMILSGGLERKNNSEGNSQKKAQQESMNSYSLQKIGSNNTNKKVDLFTPEFAREVAKKTLSWLNSIRIYKDRLENPSEAGEFISDGGYAAREDCTEKATCSIRMVANNAGLIATWAHYKYYEQVDRDPAIMKVIQNDLVTYASSKKISAIQPAIWNFKLMYELWSGQELSGEQKKLAAIILTRMQHDPSIIDPVEKEVHDRTTLLTPLTFETAIPDRTTPLTEKDNLNSIFSSEYAYTYLYIRDTKLENDQPYLNTAIGLYNKAMGQYILSNGQETEFNPYIFGITALDLYRVTGNNVFLDTATRLADRQIGNDCGGLMILCSTRAYFYHELLKVNTKQEYLRARNTLLQKALSNSYDSSEVGGFRIGKKAFYSENQDLGESLSYELIPNALFTRILIEL